MPLPVCHPAAGRGPGPGVMEKRWPLHKLGRFATELHSQLELEILNKQEEFKDSQIRLSADYLITDKLH